MKLIIEARGEDSDGNLGPPIAIGAVRRRDGHLADLGMSLAEGRSLLGQVQFALVFRARENLAHRAWPRAIAWLHDHSVVVVLELVPDRQDQG